MLNKREKQQINAISRNELYALLPTGAIINS